jgi:hypothetical protein
VASANGAGHVTPSTRPNRSDARLSVPNAQGPSTSDAATRRAPRVVVVRANTPDPPPSLSRKGARSAARRAVANAGLSGAVGGTAPAKPNASASDAKRARFASRAAHFIRSASRSSRDRARPTVASNGAGLAFPFATRAAASRFFFAAAAAFSAAPS